MDEMDYLPPPSGMDDDDFGPPPDIDETDLPPSGEYGDDDDDDDDDDIGLPPDDMDPPSSPTDDMGPPPDMEDDDEEVEDGDNEEELPPGLMIGLKVGTVKTQDVHASRASLESSKALEVKRTVADAEGTKREEYVEGPVRLDAVVGSGRTEDVHASRASLESSKAFEVKRATADHEEGEGEHSRKDLPWYRDPSRWRNYLRRHGVSEKKLGNMREAFILYDSDRDGKISVEEFGICMRSLGQIPTQAELADMCAEIDINGNATVDFKEFVILMTRQMRADDCRDAVKEAFAMFDLDGDGFISHGELRHMLTGMGEKLTHDEVDEIIREADTNGDGQIDLGEFLNIINMGM